MLNINQLSSYKKLIYRALFFFNLRFGSFYLKSLKKELLIQSTFFSMVGGSSYAIKVVQYYKFYAAAFKASMPVCSGVYQMGFTIAFRR